MRKFFAKAVVGVMYSRKLWSVYKTGVWLLRSLTLFLGLLALQVGAMLYVEFSSIQPPIDMYSSSMVFLLFLVSGIVSFFQSLSFQPEQKLFQVIKEKP